MVSFHYHSCQTLFARCTRRVVKVTCTILLHGMTGSSTSAEEQLILLALQERLLRHYPSTSSSHLSPTALLQNVLPLLLPSSSRSFNSLADLESLCSLSLSMPSASFNSHPLSTTVAQLTASHVLWQQGRCGWPNCDEPLASPSSLTSHLVACHPINDKSAVEMRTQLELIEQLEIRSAYRVLFGYFHNFKTGTKYQRLTHHV